jgi:uncharacterized protein
VTPAPAATIPDSSGRIATLDILRGFALFGMIFVHFHQNFRLSTPEATHTPVENWIGMFAWMGVEQKSWGTFAFLFGVGFAVLMRRAERRGDSVVALYLRRLGALALVGVALDAFTGFAILLDYAIWGVPLLFIRKWPTGVLLLVAVISASAWTIQPLTTVVHDWATLGREGADQAMQARSTQVTARPAPPTNYREFVVHRLSLMKRQFTHWQGLLPTSSFALFIIGLLAVRKGVFDDPRRHTRLIVTFMAIGLTSWLCVLVGTAALCRRHSHRESFGMLLQNGFGIISDQWLAFTYIGRLCCC